MFIRQTRTGNKATGESYITHRLVRSERIGGRVRQVTLLNLGRHFPVKQEDCPLLCDRIVALIGGQACLSLPVSESIEKADEGDIIWMNFTPQSGHEQAGRRPAVVLSPKAYNSRAGLLVCVPITSQIKGYPFEVVLAGSEATGAALADQVKSLDWKSRQTERKGRATAAEVTKIKSKIKLLLRLAG